MITIEDAVSNLSTINTCLFGTERNSATPQMATWQIFSTPHYKCTIINIPFRGTLT
jgi:hypothetical protein